MKIYKQTEIDELVKILKNDGVISVPTDTIYGVCARISSEKAHDNLIKVKHRPHEKLFPIMCADEKQIKSIVIVNNNAEILIQKFMPGPITLVLPKRPGIPEYVNNGKESIAIRMAPSKTLQELIIKTGCPVFMSSANQSGEPPCTSLDEIEKQCPMLNGIMEGKTLFGRASTIVDCTSDRIKILREGPISLEQIIKEIDKNSINSTYLI